MHQDSLPFTLGPDCYKATYKKTVTSDGDKIEETEESIWYPKFSNTDVVQYAFCYATEMNRKGEPFHRFAARTTYELLRISKVEFSEKVVEDIPFEAPDAS